MHIVKILCIFPIFGILCQEKSGNPGSRTYEVHKRIEVVIFDCCDLFPSRVQSRIINYFFYFHYFLLQNEWTISIDKWNIFFFLSVRSRSQKSERPPCFHRLINDLTTANKFIFLCRLRFRDFFSSRQILMTVFATFCERFCSPYWVRD
jgi:hypothetical protein